MATITFNIPIGSEGTAGAVIVDDALGSSLNLRVSPFSTTGIVGTFVDHGVYSFAGVDSDTYRLYNGSSYVSIFGEMKLGEKDAFLKTATGQTITGSNTFSGDNFFTGLTDHSNTATFKNVIIETGAVIESASWNTSMSGASGAELVVDNVPTNPNDVLRLVDADGVVIPGLTADNEWTGTNNWTGDNSFDNDPPTCASPPPTGASLANKDYVDEQVALIDIAAEGFQESPNVLRLIINGVQEDGKVYTSYAACQNIARQVSPSIGANNRVTIEIKGNGTAASSIQISDGALSGNSDFNSYVNIKGENQFVKLLINDASRTVTTGSVIIENVTITESSATATPTLNGFIFKDVYFDLGDPAITFVNCQFRGTCYIKNATGSVTFTTCKGGYVITNKTLPSTIIGTDSVSTSDF